MITDRLFHRISRDDLDEGFAALGLRKGDSVLALISLRSIGFVVDGPGAVIDAIRNVIGPQGTLVMAAFAALDPLPAPPADGLYDVAETPSATGLLSEAFRRLPDTLRSAHPVGSIAAAGPRAGAWIEGHETHASPFEAGTPLDRFVAEEGRILAIGTHLGPLLPLLQERAGFPFLYREQARDVEVRTARGAVLQVRTRLFRSESCQVVILQGERPESRDYALMRDYALVFPSERERHVERDGFLRQNLGRLIGRLERLKQRGVVTSGQVGRAEAVLIEARPFCEQVGADLAWEVEKFREEYDPERIALLGLSPAGR